MPSNPSRGRAGGNAGRGTRGGASHTTTASGSRIKRTITDGLSDTPLQTLEKPAEAASEDIVIKDLQYIGSYNWTTAKKPTILVPGSPAYWREKPLPFQLVPDQGESFIDQNRYRMPSTPLYPLFRAVDIVETHFEDSTKVDWDSVDFVTDRSNLRKLLRWITGGSTLKDFRIDAQLAGRRTILFTRWESRLREYTKTYGFSFEHELTENAPGCEKSAAGHHRIIQYDFAGLKLVVRFEVDACIAPSPSTDLDALAASMASLSVKKNTFSSPQLDVIIAGARVPQDSIIELATTSGANYGWKDKYPQLYFSQTQHHFLGKHSEGLFRNIQKRQLGDEVMKYMEESAQDRLKQLRHALQMIQDLIVRQGQDTRLSLICSNKELKLFERAGEATCLPEDILERFTA
ncbi:uncharacterized protein FIBRA_01544 [Fibroporia radiculosa]|uniref:Geranylgeranyl pyrophosphate synthetase n=1 Tax=Fibroporia radiculosa TaxID=599839 RepID=J4I8J6_9APHY|nr:uncharacterized protein FIBRA_01544 [Fibroporia radiculosa]CCL99526.1 predicted protein [Fibroporia radiculosa]